MSQQSQPSPRAGLFASGAFFSLIGVAVFLFFTDDLTDRSARGVPVWVIGALLLVCGIGLIVAGLRRGRA
ncbi:hypothetical protein [Kineococcus terrestris]|uniref:hypothetical protein n=1 Tax=Kineococcus terrestris TaxID=2044856 RepID=UPI0034DAEEF1